MKIFGREPAFYVGLVEAALVFLLGWNILPFSQEQIGVIVALVAAAFGVYTAYVTRDTLLGVGIGFTKALFGLVYHFRVAAQ